MAYLSQEQRGRAESNLSETKWPATGGKLGRSERSDEQDPSPHPFFPRKNPSGIATTVAQPAQNNSAKILSRAQNNQLKSRYGSISQSAPELEVEKRKPETEAGRWNFEFPSVGTWMRMRFDARVAVLQSRRLQIYMCPRASNTSCVISESFISPRPIEFLCQPTPPTD